MINWFAIHPTSFSLDSTLISSDNKGYAQYFFEQRMKAHPRDSKGFVAAFAQCDEGDVVSNHGNAFSSPGFGGSPVQIFRIGQLALIAVLGEATAMAGRRIRARVLAALRGAGVTHAVIAGLSNQYTGYITTPEEYGEQHYEGASTEFGPNELGAFCQEYDALAKGARQRGCRLGHHAEGHGADGWDAPRRRVRRRPARAALR